MGIPPSGYSDYLPMMKRVFAGGPGPYIQPTGFNGIRIVQSIPESKLEPYYSSPAGRRAKNPGDFGIYIGDTVETCKRELGLNEYTADTWLLEYSYNGKILNIDAIKDVQFREMFLDNGKHECSQCVRYYLADKGFDSSYDSIGWPSVSGMLLGKGGVTYIFTSGVDSKFQFIRKEKLA
jgi:hypothetical protein